MKLDEFRAMTPENLDKELEGAHQELFNLRFRLSTRQLVNHREVVRVRRKIARLNTIKREKELGIR